MGKIIGIVATVVFLFGGAYLWSERSGQLSQDSSDTVSDAAAEITYFYGEECSHCKDVNAFLEENKIAEKVKFEKKEVWHNKKNASEMQGRAKECGLDVNKIGVPFLFAEGKCYIGTPDVEAYFKKAAGL